MRRALMVIAAVLMAAPSVFAQFRNLSEGYPVQMEDAEPLPHGILQGESLLRYSTFNDGTYENYSVTGLQIGFAPGWEASLAVPVIWGTVLQTTGGDLLASALYNFLSESPGVPAFALEGFVDIPMMLTPQNADLRLKFIASKTINEERRTRLHFNATSGFLTQPGINERVYRFLGSFGISREAPGDMMVAVDYSYEEMKVVGFSANLIEAGVRKGLSPSVTLSASAGAGFGSQNLLYRASAGVEIWICDLLCPPGGR